MSLPKLALLGCLLSFSPLWAEPQASDPGAVKDHEQQDDAAELQVELNRTQTRFKWNKPLAFPCEDQIKEAKAKLKEGERLPLLWIHGEVHHGPYCAARKGALIGASQDERSPVCAMDEGLDAPEGKEADKGAIKGLENPLIKALAGMLTSYEILRNPSFAKDGYDFTVVGAVFALRPAVYDRVAKVAADDKTETGDAARAILPSLTALRDNRESPDPKFMDDVVEQAHKLRQPLAKILPDVIREETAKVLKKAAAGELREGTAVPTGLKEEIEFALRTIDRSAENPQDLKCQQNSRACVEYTLDWRDHLMAYNAALNYCDNLASPQPKRELHAIVGAKHAPGMAAALDKSARFHGIDLRTIDGIYLENIFSLARGTPDKDGNYPDQPVQAESYNGRRIGFSMQKDGVRSFRQESEFDPLGGLLLSHPQAGGQEVLLFGEPKKVDGVFERIAGKPGTSIEELVRQNQTVREELIQFMTKLYKGANSHLQSAEWPAPKPKEAETQSPRPDIKSMATDAESP